MQRIALVLLLACSVVGCRTDNGPIEAEPVDNTPPPGEPPVDPPAFPYGRLIAFYRLDGDADDAVGDADGTNGGAKPARDRLDNPTGAMAFDGESSSIVITTDRRTRPFPRQGLTISAWVHAGTRKSQHVVRVGGGVTTPWGFALSMSGDAVFELDADSSVQLRRVDYPVGRWMHLAGTYDGARVRFYVDGEMVGSRPMSGDLRDNGSPIIIGTRTHQFHDSFQGRIDEIRIYDYPLRGAEIAALAGR